LRGFGVDKDYDKRKIPGQYNTLTKGLNGRMSEIEAAMGISQLNNFNFFLKRRSNNYTFLQNKFQKLKNISSLNTNVNYKFFWSPYCYALILNKKLIKYRNKIMLSLNNQGVGTSIYYPKPVPCMKYFKNKYKIKSKFNNAMRFSNNAVMLPIAQHVSKKDISYIASKVEDVIKKFS